ncbi:MAG: cupin domain-containing protein [Phototrophicaceae bacterium]
MKEAIYKFDPSSEFFIPEGCFIIEQSSSDNDPDLSIAHARVEAGVTTRWHRLHDTIERYVIISGTGRMEVGDLPPQEVRAGDAVIIPAMVRQRITNIGDEDLTFLALCSPRFLQENYEDIDDQQ